MTQATKSKYPNIALLKVTHNFYPPMIPMQLKVDEETGTSEYPEMTYAIDFVDNACAVYFALEYFMRLICSPKKLRFFLKGMNFIDFLALIPLFLTILLESIKDLAIMGKAGNSQLLISEAIIVNVF